MKHHSRGFWQILFSVLISVGLYQTVNSQVPFDKREDVNALTWSSDGQYLAVGILADSRHFVRIYDGDWNTVSEIETNGTPISIAWDASSDRIAILVTEEISQHIEIRNMEGALIVSIPQSGVTYTEKIVWNHSGSYLAVAHPSLQIWDPSTGTLNYSLYNDKLDLSSIQSFDWLSNDKIVFFAADQVLRVWDIPSNSLTYEYNLGAFPISSAISPDNTMLAVGTSTSSVEVFDAQSLEKIGQLKTDANALWLLAWSPDSTYIATASLDSDIEIWDVTTEQRIDRIAKQTEGFLEALTYSPYGGQLFYSTNPFSVDITSEPITDNHHSQNMFDGDLQIVIPAPSWETIHSILELCDLRAEIMPNLQAYIAEGQLQDFVTAVEQTSASDIPPGCAADLIAVAEALQAEQ